MEPSAPPPPDPLLPSNSYLGLNPYNYYYPPPSLPSSSSKLKIWNLKATGRNVITDSGNPGLGAVDEYLLIVAPNEILTGQIRANDLRYKGVFFIGAEVELSPTGEQDFNNINDNIPGMHAMIIDWDQSALDDTAPPFLFLANHRIRMGGDWGDYLRTGGRGQITVPNNRWPEFIYQKMWMERGSYFWSNTARPPEIPAEKWDKNVPHSDGFQIPGGRAYRRIRAANCIWKWNGQGFFLSGSSAAEFQKPHPDGKNELRFIQFQAMPTVDPSKPWRKRKPRYINSGGDLIPLVLDRVYAEKYDGPTTPDDLGSYFSPEGTYSGNEVTWAAARKIFGKVIFETPTTPVLNTAETGKSHRITSYTALRRIFS